MPDVAGGLAFEYNLTAQNGQQITNLILNASTLEGIFTGSINNWDNSADRRAQPRASGCPMQPIDAYYRSDPSGENYLLGDYFLHTDRAPDHCRSRGGAGTPCRRDSPPPPGPRSRAARHRTSTASRA